MDYSRSDSLQGSNHAILRLEGVHRPRSQTLHTETRRLDDGCILWGSRVVVPQQGRETVLEELHEGHPGIARMKALARSFVWWPGIDKELELKVKQCES